MADMIMGSQVSYSQLRDIEEDFEDVEAEILRQQAKHTDDLYARRAKLTSGIPGFWPLVLEQAPPEVDEYMQPSDAALLNSALTDVSVERFELATGGDPRSVAVRLTFADNEHFAGQTLEKKFWWRFAPGGWSGLVSEPVDIAWKSPDKDLTQGLLGLVCRLREAEHAAGDKGLPDDAPPKKALLAQMEEVGLGGVSFFAFFGFCGRRVSHDASQAALKVEQQRRADRKAGKIVEDDDDDDDEYDDGLDDYETEIFPTGDDVAVCFAEDIWPNAIKYFLTSQQDDLSDMDFEESDDDDDEMDDANGNDQSSKN